MVKSGRTKWKVHSDATEYPKFELIGDEQVVSFDPWKFSERILNKYKAEPKLLDLPEKFQMPTIFSEEESRKTQSALGDSTMDNSKIRKSEEVESNTDSLDLNLGNRGIPGTGEYFPPTRFE
ncbi:hypothetical protein [Gimesia panareensis]|uniref:hypothetical protein n=1 Tax=Gimesia panareensis TaxID=2527978 RepID=UPI0011A43B20|nr:hypothetical protein [Gimesia panareensis]